MTFLQYVAERLMGAPAKAGGAYGESYWCCPFHNDTNPSFHTMPHKPEYKDRWRCFGCQMRGDEADLMAGLMPGEDWPRRRARLLEWRQDYEREQAASSDCHSSLRGRGDIDGQVEVLCKLAAAQRRESMLAGAAWADLSDAERKTLIDARTIMRRLNASPSLHAVTFDALADYCADSDAWQRDMRMRWAQEAMAVRASNNGRA